MKETTTVRLSGEESPTARQRSHVMREKWEESWLAQQRGGTAVIRQAADQSTAVAGNTAGESTRSSEALAGVPMSAVASMSNTTPHTLDPDRREPEGPRFLAAAPRRSLTPLHAGSSPEYVMRQPATERVPAGQGERASSDRRGPLRSCIFWRRAGSIEGAMRLRDPDRSAEPILAQLQQWVRESGAYLRRVLINGRAVWRAQLPAGPAAGREPPAASNRHTYI